MPLYLCSYKLVSSVTLLGDLGHVESRFHPFGDSVVSVKDRCKVCPKRIIGSEIVLDIADDSPS